MYQTYGVKTENHNIQILANHIKTLHNGKGIKEAFAEGVINVILDGRAVAAGCSTGFERLAEGMGVVIDGECDGRKEGEVTFIITVKEIAVLFAQKTNKLLEFAVFESTANGWLNHTNVQ